MAKQSISVFDKRSFGGWLMGERKSRGFSNADTFASEITERTGYPVSGRTILNLEHGKHEPCLSLIVAISYTLYGSVLSDEMVRWVRMSANGGLAALMAFPEYDRSEYKGIVMDENQVGIFIDCDENGKGGKLIMRPNPLAREGR